VKGNGLKKCRFDPEGNFRDARQGIKDPRIGFVTVTRVRVTDDCRSAKIYFSVMGTIEQRDRSIEGSTAPEAT